MSIANDSLLARIRGLHAELGLKLRGGPSALRPDAEIGVRRQPLTGVSDWAISPMKRFQDVPELLRMGRADMDADSDWSDRRGWTIACMQTGIEWSLIEKAVRDCVTFGNLEAASFWKRHMRPAKPKAFGFVYAGTQQDGMLKIGFSTKPEARAKALKLKLFHMEPATLLHEWTIHRLLTRFVCDTESYRSVPGVLFGGVA